MKPNEFTDIGVIAFFVVMFFGVVYWVVTGVESWLG